MDTILAVLSGLNPADSNAVLQILTYNLKGTERGYNQPLDPVVRLPTLSNLHDMTAIEETKRWLWFTPVFTPRPSC